MEVGGRRRRVAMLLLLLLLLLWLSQRHAREESNLMDAHQMSL